MSKVDHWQKFGTFNPTLLQRVKSLFIPSQPVGYNKELAMLINSGLFMPSASAQNQIEQGYNKNLNVYSVIDRISTKMATSPLREYKVIDDKSYRELKSIVRAGRLKGLDFAQYKYYRTKALEEVSETSPLNRLLQNPNEEQGQTQFLKNAYGYKLLTGDSYIYANMIGSKANPYAGELYNLPSNFMTINVTNTFPQRVASYTLGLYGLEPFAKETILHSKYWNPNWDASGQHLYGFSPLQSAWIAMLQDNESRTAAYQIIQNRGLRGVLSLAIPNGLSNASEVNKVASEQAGIIKERFKQTKQEYKDDIIVTVGGASYVSTGLSPNDLKILDYMKMGLSDICRVYKVSDILFNNGSNPTYDNYTTAELSLVTNAVIPELLAFKDDLNSKLPDWGFKGSIVDFDLTVFKELDANKKDISTWMNTAGCFTPNEMREALGYDVKQTEVGADPMDNVYKLKTFATLQDIADGKTLNTTTNQSGSREDEENQSEESSEQSNSNEE